MLCTFTSKLLQLIQKYINRLCLALKVKNNRCKNSELIISTSKFQHFHFRVQFEMALITHDFMLSAKVT